MAKHTYLVVSVFVAGLVGAACADEGESDRGSDVATGIALMRAGLQLGHEGIVRFESAERGGLGEVREGLGMMTEGFAYMHAGFDELATTYVAGGQTIHGMGTNSRCGTVEAVATPIGSTLVGMDGALGMLSDDDVDNDYLGGLQFHHGRGNMAVHLGAAVGVMQCMGRPLGAPGAK